MTDRQIIGLSIAGTITGSLLLRGWHDTAEIVLAFVVIGFVVAGVGWARQGRR